MSIPHECRLYKQTMSDHADGKSYALVVAHAIFTIQELLETIVWKVLHIVYRSQIVDRIHNHKHNCIINLRSIC